MTKNELKTIIVIVLKKVIKMILRAAYLYVLFWILLFSLSCVMLFVFSVISMDTGVLVAAIFNGIMMTVNVVTALVARRFDRFTYLTHMVITIVHGAICAFCISVSIIVLLFSVF